MVAVNSLVQSVGDFRGEARYRALAIATKSPALAVGDKADKAIVSTAFEIFGRVKSIKHKGGNVITDVTYTLTIKDQDGTTVYTQAAIAKAVDAYTNLTADNIITLAGKYTLTWSWATTEEAVIADAFHCVLYPY